MTNTASHRWRIAAVLTLVLAAGILLAEGIDRAAYAAGSDTAASVHVRDIATQRLALSEPPTVSSPVDAWDVLHQYGYVWGGMIIVFAIGTVLAKRAEDEHWINKDHALPILTGVLGTIGAALQAKFAGGSWAVVPLTLMGVVTLIIQNRKKPTPGVPSSSVAAVAGAAVVFIVALAFSSTAPGCGPTLSKDLHAGAAAGISCAEAKIGATVPEVGLTVAEDAAQIVAAGKDGWADALAKLGLGYGSDAVACGVKMAKAMWTIQVAGSPVAFEKPAHVLRAEQYLAGKKFK